MQPCYCKHIASNQRSKTKEAGKHFELTSWWLYVINNCTCDINTKSRHLKYSSSGALRISCTSLTWKHTTLDDGKGLAKSRWIVIIIHFSSRVWLKRLVFLFNIFNLYVHCICKISIKTNIQFCQKYGKPGKHRGKVDALLLPPSESAPGKRDGTKNENVLSGFVTNLHNFQNLSRNSPWIMRFTLRIFLCHNHSEQMILKHFALFCKILRLLFSFIYLL